MNCEFGFCEWRIVNCFIVLFLYFVFRHSRIWNLDFRNFEISNFNFSFLAPNDRTQPHNTNAYRVLQDPLPLLHQSYWVFIHPLTPLLANRQPTAKRPNANAAKSMPTKKERRRKDCAQTQRRNDATTQRRNDATTQRRNDTLPRLWSRLVPTARRDVHHRHCHDDIPKQPHACRTYVQYVYTTKKSDWATRMMGGPRCVAPAGAHAV